MKLAFVSQLDSKDIHSWSGTPFFMVQSLREEGHEVIEIGPLHLPFERPLRVIQRVINLITGKVHDFGRSPFLAKSLSRQALKMMGVKRFDVILCPASIVAAGMETSIPIVTWEDATFAGMLGYYPGKWERFSKSTVRNANELQQMALSNASISVFASEWAADTARKYYKVDPTRIAVVPLGANITKPPTRAEVDFAMDARMESKFCRLLFIGVDWHRKGGDLVVETARLMRENGIPTFVDVVGCNPDHPVPEWVHFHGFISKSSDASLEKLKSLYLNAHFLFVPSLAECFGLVFSEAAAFGIPSISRATGGIPSAIVNGESGFVLGAQDPARRYADLIIKLFKETDSYRTLCKSSRRLYEEQLNWQATIKKLTQLLEHAAVRRMQ